MNVIRTQIYPSPTGDLLLGDWRGELVLCDWLLSTNGYASDSRVPHHLQAVMQETATDLLCETVAQLNAYFVGRLRTFNLPLYGAGTPFQQSVWLALREIPYGVTRSYQDIACAVGNPRGTRAVAGAIRHNPLSVIVPCHRVIGKNGQLTGYNGGTGALYIKERLLALEQRVAASAAPKN
ncbi:methylated-DNA--[protein]-cysteine S-methyltransferase [Cardiobacterium valvarum]|uniref:methylated-DNA--[protein]-cysteine S-methyltransferase n=1 Tax=Cardiobacterium valvarum F0432 TaxID=797473 RepID=G9ZH03_9GAMM|nr:methylated-DNA--[protein]-cysteine S-methyltransferase [Cardiobacterium valvarum]EHM52844.1 6-O-methylguanine DNA methyltransferase, DNA binding domain protein [Cardiobacterium valvarum F0432]